MAMLSYCKVLGEYKLFVAIGAFVIVTSREGYLKKVRSKRCNAFSVQCLLISRRIKFLAKPLLIVLYSNLKYVYVIDKQIT